MSPLDVFSEPVWQRLTWTLLHFLWQGLAVAVLLAAVLRWFPVRRARPRYATCLAAMLAMAACPLVTFGLLGADAEDAAAAAGRRSPTVASRDVGVRSSLPAEGTHDTTDEVVVSRGSVGLHEGAAAEDQAAVDRPVVSVDQPVAAQKVGLRPSLRPLHRFMRAVQPYLLAGWIAGVVALGGRLLLGQMGVQWLRRGRRPISAELVSRIARLGERLGLRAFPKVFVSEKVREAVVVGLLRPMVLLPACWLTEMTPEVLEAVIAHELAHVRRWDLWVNLLQRLMETLLFYQPAVWWVSRRIRLEREMCCDELAVAATGERMAYATALSQAAHRGTVRNKPLLGATMGGTEMTLLSRVHNVLGLSPGRERARWWPAGLLALLVPVVIWCASAGITRPGSGEAQAEEKGQGDRGPGSKVTFDSVSMSVKSGWRLPAEHVEIKADGSCLYRIEERPARGQQERWPPARLVSRVDAKRLRQLEELLEKTVWLTAPGGEGPAPPDADEYTITVVREGKTRSITCDDQWPEPYRSLVWFFRGIVYQENLLYQLTSIPAKDRVHAWSEISSSVQALEGKSGKMFPSFDIDYTRYLPTFTSVVRKPSDRGNEEELITAIQLVTFLRAESEFEHIAAMSHDRDLAVRQAVAQALADFGGQRAVPVLAKMARSTEEAIWGLIRLGAIAVPSIVEMVQKTESPDDWLLSERIVRGYMEHWNELPGPVDERVVAAVRKALAAPPTDSIRTEYHRGFLEVVESRPVPAGDLSCRIDYQTVYCPQPMRLIHGWYTVADGKIVEHGAAPAPEPGTKVFGLKFEVAIDGGRPRIRAGWGPVRGPAGEQPQPVVAETVIDVPQGTHLEVIYQYHRDKPKLADSFNPVVRVTTQYRTLWEGRLVKDGRTLKRIVYVARVAGPDDPAQQFAPPAVPASTKAEPPKPPRQVTFRGLDLTNAPKVSDPKILHDLEMARRNDAIKAAGGQVREATQAVVVYKSPEEKAPSQEFVVFHDAERRVFYVLVMFKEVGKRIESQYCGPFEGDPFQKLGLPGPPKRLEDKSAAPDTKKQAVGGKPGLRLAIGCGAATLKEWDEIPIVFTVANDGRGDYKYIDRDSSAGGRMSEYVLEAFDEQGNAVPNPRGKEDWDMGGLGRRAVLGPGESFAKTIVLNRWALVTKAGTYKVIGTYIPERAMGQPKDLPAARSEPIAITIEPRSDEEKTKYIEELGTRLAANLGQNGADELVRKLMYTCDRRIAPRLIEALYHDPGTGDWWAREALNYYLAGDPQVTDALLAVAAKRGMAEEMFDVLRRRGCTAEQLRPVIEVSLSPEHPQTWHEGARAAMAWGDDRFTPRLIAIATDANLPPRNSPREQAIRALPCHRTDEAVAVLKRLLEDPNPAVREVTSDAIRMAYLCRDQSKDALRGRPLRDDDFDAKYRKPLAGGD